jgi:hypothetical protein
MTGTIRAISGKQIANYRDGLSQVRRFVDAYYGFRA